MSNKLPKLLQGAVYGGSIGFLAIVLTSGHQLLPWLDPAAYMIVRRALITACIAAVATGFAGLLLGLGLENERTLRDNSER